MSDRVMLKGETLDKMVELLATIADNISDPETRERVKQLADALNMNALIDGPISDELLGELKALKDRFHNDPEVADALQKAIDACEKASENSWATKGLFTLIGAAIGAIATAIILRK